MEREYGAKTLALHHRPKEHTEMGCLDTNLDMWREKGTREV
jgi:hypothetical protein